MINFFKSAITNCFKSEREASATNILADIGPLYHSYHLFGVRNEQLPGMYKANQACKETILLSYILFALAKCKKHMDSKVTFAELFCADGYFAMAARYFGVSESIGIDNNRDGHFATAQTIATRLGIDRCRFIQMDVNKIDTLEPVDIVANIGGLYHVENPEEIVDKSYRMARRFLIVQTVVSLATDADDYYESPAPGWTWGNRFSLKSFEKMIEKKGWHIIDRHFNLLEGNDRLEERGSIYFLIQKD